MSEHCSPLGRTPRFPVAGPGEWCKAPWIPLRVLVTVLLVVVFSLLQRKSSKAKEKKQKRLEERAAMDAVCAKVDAANRVTLLFYSSLNFSLVFFFFKFDFLAPPSGRSVASYTQTYAQAELAQVQRKV